MSTMKEIYKDLSRSARKLPVAFMVDGQFYEPKHIRSIWVKQEKDFEGEDCFGIADEEDPESFQVLVFE